MAGDGRMGQEIAAGDGSFSDEAIRAELRKIVERDRNSCLEKLAATKDAVRAECEVLEDVSGKTKQQMYSKFQAAESQAARTYEMILDFIERC